MSMCQPEESSGGLPSVLPKAEAVSVTGAIQGGVGREAGTRGISCR